MHSVPPEFEYHFKAWCQDKFAWPDASASPGGVRALGADVSAQRWAHTIPGGVERSQQASFAIAGR